MSRNEVEVASVDVPRGTLKVRLIEAKGERYDTPIWQVDFRIWWQDNNGEWRATKSGFRVPLAQITDLNQAVLNLGEFHERMFGDGRKVG